MLRLLRLEALHEIRRIREILCELPGCLVFAVAAPLDAIPAAPTLRRSFENRFGFVHRLVVVVKILERWRLPLCCWRGSCCDRPCRIHAYCRA